MKIIDFFDLTKFGGVLAASELAAALIILIQFSWMANTRLVRVDLENTQIFEELKDVHAMLKEINSAVKINSEGINSNSEGIKSNSEEIKKVNSALSQLLETVGKNSAMLEEVQSQFEDYVELGQRATKNEEELDEFAEKSEFLRGQLETILSSKQ